jgi:hypothetical protein
MATEDPRVTVVDPDPDLSVEDEYDEVTDPDSPTHRVADGKRKRSGLAEWIIVVVVAISSALLVRAYVLQQFAVEGTSMLNTLHPSDRVLVNKLSYHLHDPRRGDVVVLKRIETNAQERDLIKRVVGLPGETMWSRPTGSAGPAQARVRDGRQPWRFARQPRRQCRSDRIQQSDRPRLRGHVAFRRLAVVVTRHRVVHGRR